MREPATPKLRGLFDLNGTVELHCEIPEARYLIAAERLGITDLVIKWPGGADSGPLASYINAIESWSIKLWGGVVLDRAVGGLNPSAVTNSAKEGGTFVWMPTVDARHHRRINNQSEEASVRLFGDGLEPLPELLTILDIIAANDQVLGTGHISPDETEALVHLANERNVRQVIVNHPLFLGASNESLRTITRYPNVVIEHCYVPTHEKKFDIQKIVSALNEVPPEQSVIADFGDLGNEPNIADALAAESVAPQVLDALTVANPRKILGYV